MDCSNAQLLMLFYRPGQTTDLTADDSHSLEDHLKACPSCSTRFTNLASTDRGLRSSFQSVIVPATLKTTLLATTTAKLSSLWWKRWSLRTTGLGVMLLGTLLAYGTYRAVTRPNLDLDAMAFEMDSRAEDPERVATDWLTHENLLDQLPEELDLRYATFTGYRDLQGVRVPAIRLDLPNTRHAAWVYFLAPGEFSTKQAHNAQPTSNTAVRVYRDLPRGGVVVIIYTGNDLKPFLRMPAITAQA